MRHFLGWFAHHAKHRYATGADKSNNQHGCQNQKDDIEDRGVVPLDPLRESSNIAVLWNDAKRIEKELYNIAGGCHRNVEGEQDVAHHPPAIVLAVNVEDGQDDQVRENETDDTA